MTNTKVLVTGGAGFIGSNLCKSLLENTPHFFRVSTQSITASKKFHGKCVVHI
ncbi:MAG: NAD-dependent epimerase/dehydratase family protein [Bacteroidota bacterium]